MIVETVQDCTDIYPNMFEGSVMSVISETKLFYRVLFCSAFGSYKVSVPKNRCIVK